MREILFRGKRIDNGEWVEGDFLAPVFEGISWILPRGEREEVKVDPSTVGQYTGLCDKNGKKIFEGDIVEVNHDAYPGARGKVFFKNGSFMLEKVSEVLSLYGFLPWCNVIGNCHDNPELLEVSHATD